VCIFVTVVLNALQSFEGLVRHTVYQWKAFPVPCAMVLKYKIIKARLFAKINFYVWSAFTLLLSSSVA